MNNTKNELIFLTKKLIQYKTLSNNKREIEKCFNFIKEYLQNTGLYLNTYNSNKTLSLLVGNSKSNTPDILFNGHIDVVKGNENQFYPFIKENRIYGRGAVDMKGSIAVLMYLMKTQAKKCLNKIAALFVSDEEIDGKNGTKYVFSKGLKPKFTIICEESNFDIVVKQKGGFVLTVETFGKKAHSAEPYKGENAIDKAIEIYNVFKQALAKNKVCFNPTINIGKIAGGISVNFVPDYTVFELDIRFTTKKTREKIADIIRLLNKRTDVRITVKSYKSIMKSGICQKQIQILKKCVKQIIGKNPILQKTSYSSDGRFFTEKNLPVVEFGPRGENYHADNEYVEIESLIQYLIILKKFIYSNKIKDLVV